MTLLFVRHGQASFDGPDYDLLSELGRRQARAVGRWLGERHPALRLFAGPRRRHLETALEAREGAREVGTIYGVPEAAPLLDEIPVDDILRVYLPRVPVEPGARAPLNGLGGELATLPRGDRIALIYRAVALWWSDTAHRSDFESAAAFEQRVVRAIDALGPSMPSCAFTSAGPLYATLARLPSTKSPSPVEAADIANCAVVELRPSGPQAFQSTAISVAAFLPPEDVTFI